MIPKEFENFLSLISRNKPSEEKDYLCFDNIFNELRYKYENKEDTYNFPNFPKFKIWIPKNYEIKYESVLEKIYKTLRAKSHFNNLGIVEMFLFIFCILKEYSNEKLTNVEIFNNLISLIKDTELSQYYFLNLKKEVSNTKFEYDFFDFKIGNIDFDKIKYKSIKAGSWDVYERYIDNKKNNLTIERKSRKIKTLSIWEFDKYFKLNPKNPLLQNSEDGKILHFLINEYFYRMEYVLNYDFLKNFEIEQDLYYSLSSFRFPISILKNQSTKLNIFFNIGESKHGWCVPGELEEKSFIDYMTPWKKNLNEGIAFFGLENIKAQKNWPLIKSFTKFVSLGLAIPSNNKYITQDLGSAYMHFIIAFEILFESNQVKLSERLAVIVSFNKRKMYEENLKLISNLLEQRNEYIHSGVNIEIKDYEDLATITKTILFWILNLNKKNELFDIKEINTKLDAISAIYQTKNNPPEALIEPLYFDFKEIII